MCASDLSPLLSRLFHLPLKLFIFPTFMKQVLICSIPKCDDPSDFDNCRLLPAVPVILEVFETFISGHLRSLLDHKGLFKRRQYDF